MKIIISYLNCNFLINEKNLNILQEMCGFTVFVFENKPSKSLIADCINKSMTLSHRGPDHFRFELIAGRILICFFRLAINDTTVNGNQPFTKHHNGFDYYLVCNGEFYNHKDFNETGLNSHSDCEFLLNHLIETDMNPELNRFNSEHSFIAIKCSNDGKLNLFASTDRFGIRPLFFANIGFEKNNCLAFSSELQAVSNFRHCRLTVNRFNSAHYMKYEKNEEVIIEYKKYYSVRSIPEIAISFEEAATMVREALLKSVKLRLMSDRKIGFFLSGGLDSTCVCICAKLLSNERIKTFSIGFPGSDDEIYARKVSEELDTDHTHFVLSKKRYLQLIPEIVRCNGSFDTTTTRASIGQYECSRLISETDCVVMLSGDGSDELFFSYDDSKHCPSYEDFKERTYHLLENIHTSDGLRADRCVSHFGLELRLPFLDFEFVNLVLSLPVEYRFPKNGVTKPLLRQAFRGLISDEIIDRPKVTFSDGVGNKQDQTRTLLKTHFENFYEDDIFELYKTKYTFHCVPTTKEEMYYREVFANFFSNNESVAKTIPDFWRPIFKQSDDPSAWYTENV